VQRENQSQIKEESDREAHVATEYRRRASWNNR
jgi:hypothetical protein